VSCCAEHCNLRASCREYAIATHSLTKALVLASRPSREEDLHCIASLHASEAELRARVARQDVQLTQMKAELLLREESYNKRFATAGGAAGRRLSVNRAKGSHDEMMDWMLGGAEASAQKTGRQRAANARHALA